MKTSMVPSTAADGDALAPTFNPVELTSCLLPTGAAAPPINEDTTLCAADCESDELPCTLLESANTKLDLPFIVVIRTSDSLEDASPLVR
jgi:hypothetical protein